MSGKFGKFGKLDKKARPVRNEAPKQAAESARAAPQPPGPLYAQWLQGVLRKEVAAAAGGIVPSPESGEPLGEPVRARMEAAFQHDLSHVRVHRDAESARAAAGLAAHAFTRGSHVFFGAREPSPGTARGDRLLAHEIAHVVQHDRGGLSGMSGVAPADHPAEREAHRHAERVSSGPAARSWPVVRFGPRAAPMAAAAPILRYAYSDEELEHYAALLNDMGIHGPSTMEGEGTHRHRVTHPVTAADLRVLRSSAADGGLEPAQLTEALANLEQAGSGVQRGWNAGQDDLGWRTGPADRDHAYWTPYHYGHRLAELSRASGATDYGDFLAHHAVMARLAGAPMRIHPRSIYFVAAAQLGMDRSDGAGAGGHYIAPPALQNAIRDIRRRLRPLTRTPPHMTDRVRRSRRATLEQAAEDARQVVHSAREFQQQGHAAVEGGRSAEEPEAIVPWLLEPERAVGIKHLQIPPEGTDVLAAAERLYGLLEGAPGRVHGMGAMDAHGTAHAMGLAIDYGTSSESNAENRGVPDENWPFLYYLMDHFGASVRWDPPRPSAIHNMTHDQRRQLSLIVQQHALEAYRTITGHGPDEPRPVTAEAEATPEAIAAARRAEREARSGYNALVRDVRTELRSLLATLRRLSAPRARLTGVESEARERAFQAIADLRESIAADIRTLDELPPSRIRDRLTWYDGQLEALEGLLDPVYETLETEDEASIAAAQAALAAAPLPAPSARDRRAAGARRLHSRRESALERARARLAALEADRRASHGLDESISGARTEATAAARSAIERQWHTDQLAELRETLETPTFRQWIRRAAVSGIYSQPDPYVEGIEGATSHPTGTPGVGEAHFYGGHHWDIAPMSVITNDAEYGAALERDMTHRTPADLAAIVEIIRSWPQGSTALDADAILLARLRAHGWTGGSGGGGGTP